MDLSKFIKNFSKIYSTRYKIKGCTVFLVRNPERVPPYIVETVIKHGIVYEDNIFLSLEKVDKPFGIESSFAKDLCKGIRYAVIKYGYQEIVNVEKELRNLDINERLVFYRVDNVYSENLIWKLFGLIKKFFSNFTEFYKLPPKKVYEVVVRIEI